MHTISRREFLGRSTMGIAAAGCLSAGVLELGANPLGLPLGFQAFSVRQQLAADLPGTLKELAALGYQSVELCSPVGYESNGFGFLKKMSAKEVRRIFADAGIRCTSCHYEFYEFTKNLGETLAYAKELGLGQMILSSFEHPKGVTSDVWKKAAYELNKIGEETLKAGVQMGFHNHPTEMRELDGVLIYDMLMGIFDPKLVKMQFHLAVISQGFEATTYFDKYPGGRFISLHLSDYSSTEKRSVPVGQGIIDWKKLFAAAKGAGVRNYYVETSVEAMKASAPFLRAFKG